MKEYTVYENIELPLLTSNEIMEVINQVALSAAFYFYAQYTSALKILKR